ncbi:hypothetical protein [Roseivirga sp. E12]|uniref:hypothetical protein n=1 Tax=Roseivirga sp. E12 TaxID=2819237 RepID=UPI001ABCA562|nr:hypothetical protein [Roseivirga sp. E12]MBO3700283.1 hypothetical protein [Roseivirga sp. E12]
MANLTQESKEGRAIMNVKLRKRHRYMWMVLGVALPLLCLEAIEAIPENTIADIPRHSCSLDIGICGIDNAEYPIIIEQSKSANVLSLKIKAPLKSAFTLAYLSDTQELNENASLLGAIHTMGDYSFGLESQESSQRYLLLVDKLNNKTLYHQLIENSTE